MRVRTILAVILGASLFATAANAGGNREACCRQNVNAKVKAHTVKKADFDAEYGKCMSDPNYQ